MSEISSDDGKIDITRVLYPYLKAMLKLWWVIALCTASFAGVSWFRTQRTYVPSYVASSTVSVGVSSANASNGAAQSASQLAKVFPYILTSGVLTDIVAQDLGVSSIKAKISVSVIEDTSLLTISVRSSNAEEAYRVLQSVIENYPKVAEYVVGRTTLTVIDDSGIPQDEGIVNVTRNNSLKAGLLGFLLSLFIVWVYMALNRRIENKEDMRRVVNAPYLGTLPVYKKKQRRSGKESISLLEKNVRPDYLEAMRAIRGRIERQVEEKGQKVLMVTSSVPGEGKSTVASNLAVSFAGKGKRVILVDCDMRNPSVQDVFGIAGSFPGIARVLLGECPLDSALYRFKESRNFDLDVLLGNPKGPQRMDLLDSEEMKQFVEILKGHYDVVILDTPPVGITADAEMLIPHADAIVYVVRCEYARRTEVVRGLDQVAAVGGNVCGCILNAGRTGSSGRYSYSGKYGYGYGSEGDA